MSDYDEKPKRKNDDRDVEWSFDFANISNSIRSVFDSLAGEEEIHHSEFVSSKNGVTSARIKVDFSAGKNFLSALSADSDNLLEAKLTHVGEVEFSEEGEDVKSVRIKQKSKVRDIATPIKQGLRAMANSDEIEWHVHLSPDVPLSIDVDGGVGPTNVDLTGLTVRSVDLDAGVGQFTVILPEQEEEIDVEIDTGVGETKIYLPENINANLDIDAGVGQVTVTIPPNAAVQIRANSGIGSVNVPKNLRRLTKKEFMEAGGVWQSEGFDLAERRIVIRYDGGVGAFSVREAELA